MIEISTLSVFAVAVLALVMSPGPAVFYIVARTIEQGRLAGLISTIGIGIGTVCHIGAATLGLSALFMSSALAFNFIKYAGACYLLYLGIKTLRSSRSKEVTRLQEQLPLHEIFYQAILVNLLNPKTTLFFFAFLPQFISPSQGSIAPQIVLLGLIVIGIGLVSDIVYVLIASSLTNKLGHHPRTRRIQRYMAGGTYIALGLAAAFAGIRK